MLLTTERSNRSSWRSMRSPRFIVTVDELLETEVKESTLQADSDESPDSVSSLGTEPGSASSRLATRARVSVYKDTEN